MKNILSIFLILISLMGCSQSQGNDEIDLVGIWTLTDFNQPDKFEDTWEFTSENIFNELKFIHDGDTVLAPDENGRWILEQNKLKITVTGEVTNGEQKLFKIPQVLEFNISKDEEGFVLRVISDGLTSDSKNTRLRLTKK